MPQTHGVSIYPVIRGIERVTGFLYRIERKLVQFPYFWHRVRLHQCAPRHHRWPTYEYEWPSRQAEAHVFRLAGRFGIAVGKWDSERLDEEEAAFKAAHGRVEAPDVVGENGVTIEDHRAAAYQRLTAEQQENIHHAMLNGWTVHMEAVK